MINGDFWQLSQFVSGSFLEGNYQLMKILLSIVSSLLIVMFLMGAGLNATWIWQGRFKKANPLGQPLMGEHHPSPAPFIAGIVGAVGFVLFPFYPLAKLAWLPLLLDLGCLPYLSLVVVAIIAGRNPYSSLTDCRRDKGRKRSKQGELINPFESHPKSPSNTKD